MALKSWILPVTTLTMTGKAPAGFVEGSEQFVDLIHLPQYCTFTLTGEAPNQEQVLIDRQVVEDLFPSRT